MSEEITLMKQVDEWVDKQGVCINSLQRSNLKSIIRLWASNLKQELKDPNLNCFSTPQIVNKMVGL